jgi:hypothetical protein
MKRLCWLALIMLSCQALQLRADPQLLALVADQLVTGQALQGRFKQEKSLPFLTRPLLSSGDFSLSDDSGLRWRVSEPVVSVMTVTKDGVKLNDQAVKDRGVGELMDQLMRAFMSGNLSTLKRTFIASGELDNESWHLSLTPRSVFMKSALTSIDVRGADFLQQLIIVESSGSTTGIHFLEVTPDHAGAL